MRVSRRGNNVERGKDILQNGEISVELIREDRVEVLLLDRIFIIPSNNLEIFSTYRSNSGYKKIEIWQKHRREETMVEKQQLWFTFQQFFQTFVELVANLHRLSLVSLSFLFSSLSFFPSPSPLRLITEGRAITTSHRFARQRCGIVAFNIKNPTFFLSFCPSFYPFLTSFCLLFLSFFLPSVPSRKSSLARPRARRRGKSQMRRKKKKRSAIAVGRWWRAIRGRKEDLRAPLAAARRDRNGAITKQRRFKGLFAGFVYRVTSSASSVCTFFHPPERVRDK